MPVNHDADGKQAFVNLSAFEIFLFSLPAPRTMSGIGKLLSVC